MPDSIQLHAVGVGSFAGKNIFPVQVGIDQQDDGCIIVHITDNGRHGFLTSQPGRMVPPVTGDDFIAAVGIRSDDGRCQHTVFLDAFHGFLHVLVICHPERVALKGVQLRQRDFLYSLLLGIGARLLHDGSPRLS